MEGDRNRNWDWDSANLSFHGSVVGAFPSSPTVPSYAVVIYVKSRLFSPHLFPGLKSGADLPARFWHGFWRANIEGGYEVQRQKLEPSSPIRCPTLNSMAHATRRGPPCLSSHLRSHSVATCPAFSQYILESQSLYLQTADMDWETADDRPR